MAHLIDKDALVAEIERLAEVGRVNVSVFDESRKEKAVWLQQADVCDRIRSFINTLEVKEVDVEKEYKDFIKNSDNGRSMLETAKYFFELGLKAKR